MEETTEQIRMWKGTFGKEYTDRNVYTPEQMDDIYRKIFGVSRTELNKMFLGDLDRSAKILEVGSNLGNQLLILQKMGFENLYGIEVSSYAVEQARANTRGINIVQASVFDIPFRDGYFDLVFTSGVLIHIAPAGIKRALQEIHRCSGKYIWGFEYYADEYTEIPYRGHSELMWKADFMKLYQEQFEDLEFVKERRLKYLDNENVDVMYLLKKAGCSE